jgi:hypothetical protein
MVVGNPKQSSHCVISQFHTFHVPDVPVISVSEFENSLHGSHLMKMRAVDFQTLPRMF